MKFVFKTEQQKQDAMNTAQRAGLEACGQIYIYLLDKAEIDPNMIEPKVDEESLVDESVEQINL
jgi:hypothetical protein